MGRPSRTSREKIRYAVVGQGYIAQAAILPAFAHAKENSELVALVSDDPVKLRALSKRYDVPNTFSYSDFDDCLEEVDAVFVALPNSMHREFTLRAARAGVHVLCEKPMAVSSKDCELMIRECERHDVKLMVGYRLHFEEANLLAAELVRSGEIGDPRIFSSVFTMQVQEGNIRLDRELGGGPLYDIGIYCINAARSIFRAEPVRVFATQSRGMDPRFSEVAEMTTAILSFPGDRVAQLTSSFGAADTSQYQVIGTKGDLVVDPAYEFAGKLEHFLTIDGKTTHRTFRKRDQFAPELIYFSRCILEDLSPEPSGYEGLADVRVIEGLLESARTGLPVSLPPIDGARHPDPSQEIRRPAVRKPKLVHARQPTHG